uniref:CLIP domain-containing serine protease n=1 Tax=Anopheles coluzzii TaxID=1518534 RepID=A0A6E8W7I6_ANOCL
MVYKIRFLGLVLLLVNAILGQRGLNQACILPNGRSGRCIRIDECSKIAELTTRNVLYAWETQQIRAVLRACESDESSSDPIVCCESAQSIPSRMNKTAASTAATTITRRTTVLPTPTTRSARVRLIPQRSTTTRRRTLPTVFTSITMTTTTPTTWERRRTPATVSTSATMPITSIATTSTTTTVRTSLPDVPTRRSTQVRITSQRVSESFTTPTTSATRRMRTTMGTSRTTVRYDHLKDVLPARCGELPPLALVFSKVEDDENVHAWAVYLEIQRSKSTTKGRCVGTLIQERYVLTAAHCVHNLITLDQCLADRVCQERQAAELIVHQNYNSHARLNDIALIRVSEAVQFTKDVRPACLPFNYLFDEGLASPRMLSLGWGEYQQGTMSDSKRIVQLEIIKEDECGEQLKKWQRFNISMLSSVMCTVGVLAGQDVCEGDSGAPIVQIRDDRYFVIGVVSFGPKCGMGTGTAGMSTRVSEYKNWILTNMNRHLI